MEFRVGLDTPKISRLLALIDFGFSMQPTAEFTAMIVGYRFDIHRATSLNGGAKEHFPLRMLRLRFGYIQRLLRRCSNYLDALC